MAAVATLLAPLYLQRLGTVDIVGDDEAREVGIIQDIAERGRWALPRFNDSVFPDKPLLYHWLAAAVCVHDGACTERQVTLPSALSALLLAIVIGLAGALLFDTGTGVVGAVLIGLTPSIFDRARVARPDVLLTMLLATALLVFYAWWQDGGRSRLRRRALGVLLGLAVLAKGPVGPAVAAVTMLLFLACRRDLGRARELLRVDVLVPACVIGGSWYVIALLGWGGAFADQHFVRRYLGNVLGGDIAMGVQPSHSVLHHVTFYPLHVLLGTLPWTPLLIAALVWIWRNPDRRADARLQFLQIWIGTVVVVFSVAALKLRHYVFPALPAAALLAAPFTVELLRAPTGATTMSPRRLMGFTVGIAVLVIAAASLWWTAGGVTMLSRSDRELADVIEGMVRTQPWSAIITAVGGGLIVSAAMAAALGRRWRLSIGMGAASVVLWMLLIQPTVQSALAARVSLKPFGEAVAREVPPEAPVYFFGRVLRPVVVYARRPIPSLRRDVARLGTGSAYVIGTQTNMERLTRRGLQPRLLAEHVGRIGNLETGRVILMAVGETSHVGSPVPKP
jgi:4-amino-4-deoxy-L-arabinose transferase-like glycosyltransferase